MPLTPDDSPPVAPAPPRSKSARAAIWGALAAALLWNAFLVGRYGANIPRSDEWRDVLVLLGDEPLSWTWLWSPHSVHRIPLPRLARLALYEISGNDFRSALVANVLLMLAATLGALRAARRSRGAPSRLDVVFPLLLLGPGHFMNFLWAFQMQFVLSVALFIASIGIVVGIDRRPSPRQLALVAACILANILTGLNGVALALPLMAWLLMALVRVPTRGWKHLFAAGALLAAIGLLGIYPMGLPVDGPPVFLPNAARTALQFLGTSLGAVVPLWRLRATVVVALAAWSLFLLARAVRTLPRERWRASGLFACSIAPLLLAAFVGLGRAGFTRDAGIQPRYTSLSVPLLCIACFVFLLYGSETVRRRGPALVLALVLLAMPVWTLQALAFGRQRREQLDHLAGDVARGLPLDVIAARNGTAVYPYAPGVRFYLGRLLARRAWPFETYEPSSRVRTEISARTELDLDALAGHDLRREGAVFTPVGPSPYLLLRTGSPRAVAALELDYTLEAKEERLLRLEVRWDLASGEAPEFPWEARRAAFPARSGEGRKRLSIPIYDTLDTLRIDLDPAATAMVIHELVLLELEPDWLTPPPAGRDP